MQDFNTARGRRIGLICCHCEDPFLPEERLCRDPGDERPRLFRQECRDCFWPIFTHPRWLSCRRLYCCCRRRCRDRN